MKKAGIITYHSAYNFGSCLQAYATVQTVKKFGFDTKIINYRPSAQYKYYKIFHFGRGVRSVLKSALYLPKIGKYRKRKKRYEKFISEMPLTNEIREPLECGVFSGDFDVYVSGSDQIWNKHSNELSKVDFSYMDPYLLAFTEKKKISYASSIVNMTDEELGKITPKIKQFSSVSCREPLSAERIRAAAQIPVSEVLDPTLLLDGKDWEREMGELPTKLKGKKYVLFYTLQGVREVRSALAALRELLRGTEYLPVIITPLAPITAVWAYQAEQTGPREFLRLVHDAAFVITNSYHGTLFALNFEKNFYSIKPVGRKDERISQILSRLGLEDRIISDISNADLEKRIVSYSDVAQKKEALRAASLEYLKTALQK